MRNTKYEALLCVDALSIDVRILKASPEVACMYKDDSWWKNVEAEELKNGYS